MQSALRLFAFSICLFSAPGFAADKPDSRNEPTPEETLMLEYINRFRADPVAEAERITAESKKHGRGFKIDWEMFRKEMQALSPVPPLVFNLKLLEAARNHSRYMILNNTQNHDEVHSNTGFSGKGPVERVAHAGYAVLSLAECVYGPLAQLPKAWEIHVAFVVDYGAGPGGMQPARPHRGGLMLAKAKEVGTGLVPQGKTFSTTVDLGARKVIHAALSVEKGAARGTARFAGGVAFVDKNGNGFYDPGEGVGGVTISTGEGCSVKTWASGAYAMELKNQDPVTLTAEFGGRRATKAFESGSVNLKFDWVLR